MNLATWEYRAWSAGGALFFVLLSEAMDLVARRIGKPRDPLRDAGFDVILLVGGAVWFLWGGGHSPGTAAVLLGGATGVAVVTLVRWRAVSRHGTGFLPLRSRLLHAHPHCERGPF